MDDDQTPPEVTLEPADNGWVVRHHQRGSGKDQPGRTIRRVASTDDEALGHAKTAMAGGKISKKKSSRDGHVADDTGEGSSSPVAHLIKGSGTRSARRRPVRSRRRA